MSFIRCRRIPVPSWKACRTFSTTAHSRQSPIPYTPTCPSPTCECAPAPQNLDIDHTTPLLNTMASYNEQVLVCTGKDDWSSRIEDEQSDAGAFMRSLRVDIGKGGKGFDPFNKVLITASSFPASAKPHSTTVLLFPSFKRIPSIPHEPPSNIARFATAYLKARTLHPMHAGLSDQQKAPLLRDERLASSLPPPEPIDTVTVLICGHGGRDMRCGVLGPLLRTAFQKEFHRRNVRADVALISHIGGHKYAGNVIIYLPPTWRAHGEAEGVSTLSGAGIWYGRVGPQNVEGVVEETVVQGRIVGELFRGGITRDGKNLGGMLEEQMKREEGDGVEGVRLRPRARAG